jgi:recombination protein RecR
MSFSPLLDQLVETLCCLPGVGPKTAQRMALQLLTRGRENGKRLAHCLREAMENIGHCLHCRIFSEADICDICKALHRDPTLLCIVENPIDVAILEQTASFRGKYFVLLGHLSPLDSIGPEELGMPLLKSYFAAGEIQEIILATNTTVEGEATAHYIAELARSYAIKITRLACGIPMGNALEYSDPHTLSLALSARVTL